VYYESKSNKYTKSKFNEWVHSSSVLIEMITLISHGVLLLDAPPPKAYRLRPHHGVPATVGFSDWRRQALVSVCGAITFLSGWPPFILVAGKHPLFVVDYLSFSFARKHPRIVVFFYSFFLTGLRYSPVAPLKKKHLFAVGCDPCW